jgi:histidinol-phosphate aminotransferase
VDEAYYEFVRRDDFPDAVALTRTRPGTLVGRTFSKIYGLAGLRIGYGIADPELAGYLERARHPFNVNRLAEVAALAALDDDEHVARTRELNDAGARFLTESLERLGCRVWPTDANYLLVEIGPDYYDKLLHEGVIVRPMAGFGLTSHLRVSIGTAAENERLIKAIERIREAEA